MSGISCGSYPAARITARGAEALRAVRADLTASRAEGLERASVPSVLQALIDRGQPVKADEVHKGWMEIDTIEDYRRACAEVVR